MSDVDGTCEYVLDPDDPETWGGEEGDECYADKEVLNEDGVWTCHHDAEAGRDACIFHLPVTEKDGEAVVDAFLTALDDAATGEDPETKERKLQFLGSRFGEFDLTDTLPEVVEGQIDVDLTHSEIEGILDWSDSIFTTARLRLQALRCAKSASFESVKFGGDVDFTNAEFSGDVDFSDVEFSEDAIFWDTEFGGDINFRCVEGAEFGGAANFRAVKVSGFADFFNTTFDGDADFWAVEVQGDSNFREVDFRGDATFWEAEFRGDINLTNARFDRGASFENANFYEDVEFWMTEFAEEVEFRGSEFDGDPNFSQADFGGTAYFQNIMLAGGRFEKTNLTEADFTGANLTDTDFESALLSRATLFGADLRGAKLDGAVLGDIRVDEDTRFLGHSDDDSDFSPHRFSTIRSKPCCVYDPDYEADNEHADVDKAKSVYRALEELGGKHARPRLQARSFVRRQDLQKQNYWDNATADDASLEERFIAGVRWSRAKVARVTLLYGESPWRVIAWSLGIIFSFALLYPLGEWMKPADSDPITYAQIASNPTEILDLFYYSTLIYTALGFGDFNPVGLGRLLTTIETGLGAVMLALLVFILGRRAAR